MVLLRSLVAQEWTEQKGTEFLGLGWWSRSYYAKYMARGFTLSYRSIRTASSLLIQCVSSMLGLHPTTIKHWWEWSRTNGNYPCQVACAPPLFTCHLLSFPSFSLFGVRLYKHLLCSERFHSLPNLFLVNVFAAIFYIQICIHLFLVDVLLYTWNAILCFLLSPDFSCLRMERSTDFATVLFLFFFLQRRPVLCLFSCVPDSSWRRKKFFLQHFGAEWYCGSPSNT